MVAIAGAKEPWAEVSTPASSGPAGGKKSREVETEALRGGTDRRREQFGKVNREACGYAGGKKSHDRRCYDRVAQFAREQKCRRHREQGAEKINQQSGLSAPTIGDIR